MKRLRIASTKSEVVNPLSARLKCASCVQENVIPTDRILPGRTSTRADHSFLSGGGELGALIRSFDWAATPLGEPRAWPQSLRSALSICLHSSFPTAIYWGEDLRLLYNDAWAPIPAERHPAALGQPGADVWSDIWLIVGPQFRRVVETGEGFSTFDQFLPMVRDGVVTETYWNYSITPIRGEDGLVVGILNQGHDTTDRVLAERHAVAERTRLERMFDQAPGFMAMLRGPEHVFELANTAYLALVGGRNVVGAKARDALPDVEGQGFFELLDEVYTTGKAFVGAALPVEIERDGDGRKERRFVDLIYQPITDDSGRISGIFVQGSDVTDRVVAEEEVRESEARFRELIESAPDKMWVNHPDGKVAYFNFAWRDYTGHPVVPDGSSWTKAFHPDDRDRLIERRNSGIAAGEPYVVEARMLRIADGAWRWHVCRVAPVRRNGSIFGWTGMATDIDDVRRAERQLAEMNATLERRVEERSVELSAAHEQLRQSQKMEAIGQLTGGLAHDLNNMLTIVVGNLDLGKRSLAGGDEARAVRSMTNAMKGAEGAAALTRRLLAFARRQSLSPRAIDAHQLILSMSELLERALGETIVMGVAGAGDLPKINVDPHELENAVVNLAVNARDAMPRGGRLRIATELVQLNADAAKQLELEPGSYVCVSVSDEGKGMSPDVAARVFEPFFTTKEQGEGTGLGLSMVYGFVKQSNGSVQIDSSPGVGTTVQLFFPTAPHDSAEALSAPVTLLHGGNERVLLVEDQEEVGDLAETVLSEAGYQVFRARDGEDALQRLDDLPGLDILFSDVVMPGPLSGIALARKVVERFPRTRVLLTSGYSTEVIEQKGEYPVLVKPYRRHELLSRLRAILDD